MAEGGQPQIISEAVGDVPDGTLLQSGEVTYKGKGHQLHLVQRGLRLVAPQSQDKAGATKASECARLNFFLLLVFLSVFTELLKPFALSRTIHHKDNMSLGLLVSRLAPQQQRTCWSIRKAYVGPLLDVWMLCMGPTQ